MVRTMRGQRSIPCWRGILLPVFLVLVACQTTKEGALSPDSNVPADVERDAQGFETDPAGFWLKGDFHVHATGASNDTGGDSFPVDIKSVAKERGLFFVVLTDHSNSTGSDASTRDEDPDLFNQGPEFVYWDEAAALSEPEEFLLISGNEISPRQPEDAVGPCGHIGCIPRSLVDFDVETPFTDRPMGSVSGGAALEQAKARNCFTIVNHPYAFAEWIVYDWSRFDYDGMEVWNGGGGGYDIFDQMSYEAWRCDLLSGRQVVPIGASDNHRVFTEPPGLLLHPALGWPHTAVFSVDKTWPGILAGLAAGQVYLAEGDSQIRIDGYDENKWRHEGAETRYLRIRGHLDSRAEEGGTLRVVHATACSDTRPAPGVAPAIEDAILYEEPITSGDFEVVLTVDGDVGVYTATVLTNAPTLIEGSRYAALSRAIQIR